MQIKPSRYGSMLYHSHDLGIGKTLENYSENTEFETQFLTELLQPGDVCVDVGSYIGTTTIPLAQKVGPEGLVIAIEPQQHIFHTLCGNIALNDLQNVTAFQRAASNFDTAIWVPYINYEVEGDFGAVSLERQDQLKNLSLEGKAYPIATISLDQMRLAKVNLIKTDVEGMEMQVLKGSVQTIQRYKPFLYIRFDREHKQSELINYVQELGYHFDIHQTPLFNENNFANNPENAFAKDARTMYLFCFDKKPAAMNTHPQFFQKQATQIGTSSSAHEWRVLNDDYNRYLTGNGIDIGSGHCPLSVSGVAPWDKEDGDATYMEGVPDDEYDFVYSSHCLEHIEDIPLALNNWCRILKPGGYLFVAVPDWTLYEKEQWPSIFNDDHKCTFSKTKRLARKTHFYADDIEKILKDNKVELLETRLEDWRYDYSLPDGLDQTKLRNALAQICFIGRKHG